jgi:glycosyltransferase involved in cell wall biosynthesis
MSLSLLEAMSYGLPILASDIPENSDPLGNCGFYFKKNDWHSLKRKLEFMIDNPRITHKKGKFARGLISDSLNWNRVAQDYASIYRHILNNPKAKLSEYQ